VSIGPDTALSPVEAEAVRAAARPYLQAALRKGLVVGFALGFVAACVVFAAL
jgi:hypothetical protein